MAGLDRQQACWTLYSPLLSILKTEVERNYLEEAVMAYRCGRFADAKEIFNQKLPLSSSIPMLAMEYADLLTTQGLERERIKTLEAALESHELTNDRGTVMEHLLLELMQLDAHYWAYGRMAGLLSKARQISELVSQVNIDHLSDVEVGSTNLQLANSIVTVRLK